MNLTYDEVDRIKASVTPGGPNFMSQMDARTRRKIQELCRGYVEYLDMTSYEQSTGEE